MLTLLLELAELLLFWSILLKLHFSILDLIDSQSVNFEMRFALYVRKFVS